MTTKRGRKSRGLKFLEQQITLLKNVDASADLIVELTHILNFVEDIYDEELAKFSLKSSETQSTKRSEVQDQPSDDILRSMQLDDVMKLISEPEVNRKTLERSAILRFGMPRGLAVKSSRTQLLERIETLIRNEQSHLSIARLAVRSAEGE